MIPFKKTILGLVLLVLLAAGALYLAFREPRVPIPELDPYAERVYASVVDQVVQEVVIPSDKRVVALAPIPGDGSDALRRRIQKSLNRRGGVEAIVPVEEEGRDASWLQETVESLAGRFMPGKDDEEKPDLILAGRIREFTNDSDRVALALEWGLADVEQKGALVSGGSPQDEISKSIFDYDYLQLAISESSRWWRFLLWLAVLGVPPFLLLGTIRQGLKKESNLVNGGLVVVFALPGILAGWVLTAFGYGWLGASFAALSLAASLVYSFIVLTLIEEAH